MSIAKVQFGTVNSGTSSTPSATLTTASTAGNFLVAVVCAANNTTCATPSGWSLAVANSTASFAITILYCQNAASTSSLSGSLASSQVWSMIMGEYSGISVSGALDQVVYADTGAGNTGNIVTTYANEYVIAVLSSATNTGLQQGIIGWTSEGKYPPSSTQSGPSMEVQDRIYTSTGTYSYSDNNYTDGAIASFFAYPHGGTTTTASASSMNIMITHI